MRERERERERVREREKERERERETTRKLEYLEKSSFVSFQFYTKKFPI